MKKKSVLYLDVLSRRNSSGGKRPARPSFQSGSPSSSSPSSSVTDDAPGQKPPGFGLRSRIARVHVAACERAGATGTKRARSPERCPSRRPFRRPRPLFFPLFLHSSTKNNERRKKESKRRLSLPVHLLRDLSRQAEAEHRHHHHHHHHQQQSWISFPPTTPTTPLPRAAPPSTGPALPPWPSRTSGPRGPPPRPLPARSRLPGPPYPPRRRK